MSQAVIVVAYDPRWAAQFAGIASRIRPLLGTNLVALHHIGSTSVENLSAKPIIDVLAEVRDLAALESNPLIGNPLNGTRTDSACLISWSPIRRSSQRYSHPRAANDRLLKCIFWLDGARARGHQPRSLISFCRGEVAWIASPCTRTIVITIAD